MTKQHVTVEAYDQAPHVGSSKSKGVMGKLKSKLSTTFGKNKKNDPVPQVNVKSVSPRPDSTHRESLNHPRAGSSKSRTSSTNSNPTAGLISKSPMPELKQEQHIVDLYEEEQQQQQQHKQQQQQQQLETAVQEFCEEPTTDQDESSREEDDNIEIKRSENEPLPLKPRQSWNATHEKSETSEHEHDEEEDDDDRVEVFQDASAEIAAIEKAFASTESLMIVGHAAHEKENSPAVPENEASSRTGSFDNNNREESPKAEQPQCSAPEAVPQSSPVVEMSDVSAPAASPVKRRVVPQALKLSEDFMIPVEDHKPAELAAIQEIQSTSPRKAPPPRKRIGANTNEMPILASASCILRALEDERELLARQTEATMNHDPPTLSHWQASTRRSNEKLQIITEESEADAEREVEEQKPESGGVEKKEAKEPSKVPEDEDGRVEQEQEPANVSSDAGAIITEQLGERIARLLGADPWGDRQDGFDAVQYLVKKSDLENAPKRKELLAACLAAVHCGVDDRVAPVMYCALDCLVTILKHFAPILEDQFAVFKPLNQQLNGLFKSLLAKLNDTNKRTQREATQAILRLAKLKKLKAVSYLLVQMDVKDCNVLPRFKMEILLRLLQQNGIDASDGLSVDYLMRHALVALRIAEEKTRKAAVELIAALHLLHADEVNSFLAGVKPEMLRVIHRRVDELLAAAASSGGSTSNESKQNTNQQEHQQEKQEEQAARNLLLEIPNEDWKVLSTIIDAHMSLASSVVGPVIVRKLESKTWSDRKEALVDLEKHIVESKSDLRDVGKPSFGGMVQQHFVVYCILIYKSLNDSIAPVVNGAMDCFATLVKVYGSKVEWRQEEVQEMILQTLLRLFHSMQKPNNRTNRAACKCVLKMARLPSSHALRCVLSCIFCNNPERPCDPIVQMHLLKLLIPEFGFCPEGISASLVLDAVASALAHGNDKVRKAAIDVALCTQRIVGKDFVLKKLKDVKQVTLKELEKSFVQPNEEKSVTSVTTTNTNDVRPHSVHVAGAALPPVNLEANISRRLLASAPVGVGSLQCTPLGEDSKSEEDTCTSAATSLVSARRASVMSNEEENLMESILEDK